MNFIERSIEDEIKTHEEWIKNALVNIDELKNKLKWLKSAIEIPISQLYAMLESLEKDRTVPIDGVVFSFHEGDYKFILGGDGRSAPWDETRRGLICDIDSNIYFNEEQIHIIKEFFEHKLKVKKVNIVNQKRGY